MRNIIFIAALVIALGLIGFLYQQLSTTQDALKAAEQRFTDCQQVTYQLENQLKQVQREAEARNTASSPRRVR